jgi:two-component system, cell cycle response regulator
MKPDGPSGSAREPSRSITQETTLPPPAHPLDRGTLTITAGPEAGKLFVLGEVVSIGRGVTCEIQIDDPSISREHAQIEHTPLGYVLRDTGSRNGTYVDGQRVAECKLHQGASIRLGGLVRLRFALTDEEEERYARALYESSLRDPLTGAFNRKLFDERLAAELAFAVRHGSEVAVAMLDIDHFKLVNDTHGHLAGDQVLRGIVKLVGRTIRAEDVLCRYGGEEFAVIARGIPAVGAVAMAERIRGLLDITSHPAAGASIKVTLSIGVAMLSECTGGGVAALVGLADQRLYDAKAAGRNRVRGPE